MIQNYWAGVLTLAIFSTFPLQAEVPLTNLHAAPTRISPGPEDGRIAWATATMLEDYNFSHHPLDADYATQFMDSYLEKLDRQHLYFLQSDLNRFERYRTNLDRLTVNGQKRADVTPAFDIFGCFFERLQQRVGFVDDLLQHENFEFTADERILVNRKDQPHPQNLDEAKKLWRQNLRWEFLQEKLSLEDARKNGSATNSSTHSIHEQIVETLTHRYRRNLRYFEDWNNQDVLGEYLTALAHVYDPHSDYLNKEQLDQFTIGMNLALFGIGAELHFDDGYCKIARLLPGGPAEKSKLLKAGDRIVAVAQGNQHPVDVVEMSLNKTVQMIRGPKGTEVQLTLIPEHDLAPRSVIKLVRDEIPLPESAAKAKIIEMPGRPGEVKRLGVINLPSFYAPMGPSARAARDTSGEYTSVDVDKLLTKFKKENVGGVILDLRLNGGGSLEEAIRLAGLFIKEGPVVQVRAPNGRVVVAQDPDPTCHYDGPLIVLTSRFSASASEIVAAALQDYGRALIVGDISTHGKGTVQSVNYITNYLHDLKDPEKNNGALKVTIQKFYRVSGFSTQLKGVLPDIVLPSVYNYSKDIGESALDHALQSDRIRSAEFERLNLVDPYLSELLKDSAARVATNKEFEYVREEIERFRKQQEDKTVSLNEKERLREIAENQARENAREQERLTRPEQEQKVYELTLKQADLPGLPPPVQRTNAQASLSSSALATNTLAKAEGSDRTGIHAGTNAMAGGRHHGSKPGLSVAGSETEKPAEVDVDLIEAEHILEDYISLMQKDGNLTSTHSAL